MKSAFFPILFTAILLFNPFFLAGQENASAEKGGEGDGDKGNVERSERKDRLKERMHLAKEKGETEKYERLKRELQEMNGVSE